MNALKTIHTELLREGVHIVPDIETLSTAPNAMILSIGAVAVVNGKIVGEFYQNIDFTQPSAIVMGTEAEGLTDFWLRNAKKRIKIPMRGKIDSLNVSVSTAVLTFEAMRQRGF